LAFHAVPSTFWLKRSATGAACVAYTSFCSASGRSPRTRLAGSKPEWPLPSDGKQTEL
jgi:hypothetical protein